MGMCKRCFTYNYIQVKVTGVKSLTALKICLEPVCCKKQQKKVTGLWNRGPLKILNGIKLILDGQGNHLDSYAISLESFRSLRGSLFRKPVTGQELFFAVSYSKPALRAYCPNIYTVPDPHHTF